MADGEITDLLQIAKVLKSNGTDGELLMGFRDLDPEDIDLEEPVFIYYDGLPVPFFIESLTRRGMSKALVRLTSITSLEDAEEVVGQAVYMEKDALAFEDDGQDLEELIGWTLYDGGSRVGEVSGVEDIPGNPCLYVDVQGSEAMIPLHPDLLDSMNPEKKEIHMHLPEGLLD